MLTWKGNKNFSDSLLSSSKVKSLLPQWGEIPYDVPYDFKINQDDLLILLLILKTPIHY